MLMMIDMMISEALYDARMPGDIPPPANQETINNAGRVCEW